MFTARYGLGLYNSTFCPHTVYLCVLCGSENKQHLFPCTALTDWFLNQDGVCLLRGMDWVLIYNTGESEPLKCQRPQLYTHLVWRHRQHKTAHSCYYTSPRTDCESSVKATRVSTWTATQATVTVLSNKLQYNEVSKHLITGFSACKNVVKTDIYV